jgi:hypothetical protein
MYNVHVYLSHVANFAFKTSFLFIFVVLVIISWWGMQWSEPHFCALTQNRPTASGKVVKAIQLCRPHVVL